MALVPLSSYWIPQVTYGPTASAPSFGASSLDASGEMFAWILQAPKTGNIRKVHFRTGAVTSATGTDVRIETVNPANGDPSGTLWGANTNVTVPAASITANTWVVSGNLTADASVTQGDLFAVVAAPTGTPNYNIVGFNVGSSGVRLPYSSMFATGSWTKFSSIIPVVAIEYSDGTFAEMPEVFPINAINTHTFNVNSTPDERALRFSFPAPVSVCGCWLWADQDGDMDMVLYDSDGTTVLMTISFDANNRQGTGIGHHFFRFDSSISLTADTFYRLSVKPTTATNLTMYSVDVNTAPIFDQMPGGQDFSYSERTNAGAWTDMATTRPLIGLMLDGIEAGGGGGSTNIFIVQD